MPPVDISPQSCTATLYLRSSPAAPARERQVAVQARLQRLATDGHVGDAEIERFSRTVPLGDELPPLERELNAWADSVGASLVPFFDSREEYTLTGDALDVERVLVRPVMCLAVREDGELRAVYPHSADGDVRSVCDGLDALAGEQETAADDRRLELAD